MAFTTVSAANIAKQFDSEFFAEYVRENRFARYMGTDENAIIQLKEQLTKSAGDTINIPLLAKLTGAGQTGNGLLEGNEEALANYNMPIIVGMLRHAVAVTENDEQLTAMDLRKGAKSALKNWSKEKMRTDILTGLASVWDASAGQVAYGSASAAQKNAWNAANADRILFGAAKSNYSATHSTALANIDTAADRATKEIVSLAKRLAKTASPIIRPYMTDEDEETYVLFAGSLAFRDLKSSLATIHQNAGERGRENPLFRDGDLMWDGVIIREIPEIATLAGVGATASDVQPMYLCGAQALGVGIAKRTSTRTDVRDYGFVHGVAIQEMRGVRKMVYNGKDHGVFTAFVSAPADA